MAERELVCREALPGFYRLSCRVAFSYSVA